MKKVDKKSPIPLYYQLKEIILEMIENEELKPGEAIPTERELSDIHEISRVTVRKAITSLVYEGYLYREQGVGTFVAKPKAMHTQLGLIGFTDLMEKMGVKHSTKIISFEIRDATIRNKERLQLPDGEDRIVDMLRLRMANNEPILLEREIVPYYMCPDLTRELVEGNSLYKIYRDRYNYNLKKAEQIIEPIILNEFESKLLNQRKDSLALLIRRTIWLDDGRIIGYTKGTYRSEKVKYRIFLGEH